VTFVNCRANSHKGYSVSVGSKDLWTALRIAHARAVLERGQESQEDQQVNDVIAWMRRNNMDRCKAYQVTKDQVCGIKKTTVATKVLEAAVDRGLGHWEEVQRGAKGRGGRAPSPAFVLNKDA
jgi:hypothetical protein